MAAHVGLGGSAHALVADHHATHHAAHHHAHHVHHPAPYILRHDHPAISHGAAPSKKVSRGAPQTIYVAPKGRTGGSAGKTASKPLGSLTLALKRAKSGATIYLAPGTYIGTGSISGKSNITIIGAADQSSILAAPGGGGVKNQALRIYSSSNITINNVWFRSSVSGGMGLTVSGSSVTVNHIKTNGTYGDGVVVTAFGGQNGVLTADSSQFDGSQMGNGLELQGGSSATITNSTFDNNGTSPNATQFSNGLLVGGNATANITGSHFDNNTNEGMVANGNGQVTVAKSTFSNNRKGNGAIFFNQVSVNLTGNTFASNGQVVGLSTGLNGIEFFGAAGQANSYTGTAVLSGNTFSSNTANGIYVGSAGNLTISNNQFSNNVVGLFLDGTGGTINATVVGNTIGVDPNPPDYWNGIVAQGTGVTATIGGDGGNANTIDNYLQGDYIHEAFGSTGPNSGLPHVTIAANNYIQNGRPVDPSYAIYIQ